MKKLITIVSVFIFTAVLSPIHASAEDLNHKELTLEEKAAVLQEVNGGNFEASDEIMTMQDLTDMLIDTYQLDEEYVTAIGDMDMDTPDSAFFDFGGGGSSDMPFMRGNLSYVVTKLYHLSDTPIDSADSWYNLDQSGYVDVDNTPVGYPGNKQAIYLCRELGVIIPQNSETELGFGESVTKGEFTNACYSAYLLQTAKDSPVEEEVEAEPIPSETAVISKTAAVTNCYSLNVRKGPGMNYQVVQWLLKGDVVTILDTDKHWVYIKTAKGKGWVFNSYLD